MAAQAEAKRPRGRPRKNPIAPPAPQAPQAFALPLADEPPVAPLKRGAKSTYTRDVANEILDRLCRGELLDHICAPDRQTDAGFMPSQATIMRWVRDDLNGFADEYRRARGIGWDIRAERLLSIAADSARDFQIVDGKVTWQGEHVNRHRLMIDSEKWLLSKVQPERYSDAVNVNLSGQIDMNRVSDADLMDQMAQILRGANLLPSLQRADAVDVPDDDA